MSKILRLSKRKGKERANFPKHPSLRYQVKKLTRIQLKSSKISPKKINRWRVRIKRKRERMKITMMRSRLRKRKRKRMMKAVKMTRTMSMEKMIIQKG